MPETTNYMILGYAVVVIILIAMVVYLVLKARHLRAEYEMLESLEDEAQKSAEPTPAVTSSPLHHDAVSR